ncbi:Protein of unknown function, partial [Cotesia congregata]
FTIGVSVPLLATNKKGNVVFSAGFQFNYALPWNLTQLQSPSIIPSRHTDDFNLNNIYLSIENLFDRLKYSLYLTCPIHSVVDVAETLSQCHCCHRSSSSFYIFLFLFLFFFFSSSSCSLSRQDEPLIICHSVYNWSDGRQCLLRSICELAETPLNRVNTDVLVDVVHLLLTPSEDLPETVNSSHRSIDKLYHRAELLGKSGGDCASSYPGCAESPLKYFTQIDK